MDNVIAHIRKKNDLFCIQTLQEHTQGVTVLAQNFANSFGYGELAANIGILHDFGKQSKAFQDHICYASGYKNGVDKKADHKFTSATAVEHYEIDPGYKAILKYCIAGHHQGLPNLATLRTKLEEYSNTQLLKPEYPPLLPMAAPKTLTQEHLHFLVRMLFSCLVDADFLDTE
ncbi:MAG: CRISPR-associated endonuclease Cas3'', partial [Mucinivorans sp.]